jgi:hypothetical protein
VSTPSFSSFFPYFSLPDVLCDPTTSFGSKGHHLRRWLVAQPSSEGILAEVTGVSLNWNVNVRKSVHSPRYHPIIIHVISYRRDIQGKWSMARNPDRSWRHRHTRLNFFFLAAAHDSMGNRHLTEHYADHLLRSKFIGLFEGEVSHCVRDEISFHFVLFYGVSRLEPCFFFPSKIRKYSDTKIDKSALQLFSHSTVTIGVYRF